MRISRFKFKLNIVFKDYNIKTLNSSSHLEIYSFQLCTKSKERSFFTENRSLKKMS